MCAQTQPVLDECFCYMKDCLSSGAVGISEGRANCKGRVVSFASGGLYYLNTRRAVGDLSICEFHRNARHSGVWLPWTSLRLQTGMG